MTFSWEKRNDLIFQLYLPIFISQTVQLQIPQCQCTKMLKEEMQEYSFESFHQNSSPRSSWWWFNRVNVAGFRFLFPQKIRSGAKKVFGAGKSFSPMVGRRSVQGVALIRLAGSAPGWPAPSREEVKWVAEMLRGSWRRACQRSKRMFGNRVILCWYGRTRAAKNCKHWQTSC